MPRMGKTRTSLERFFDERADINPITRNVLSKDLEEVVSEMLKATSGDLRTAQGALRYLMLGPLRSVAADIEAMQRLDEREQGRRKVPKEEMGSTMRALVSPNFGLGQSRVPKALRRRQPCFGEFLYEFKEPWNGKDFMITDGEAKVFRAWSRKIYTPPEGQADPVPSALLKRLKRLEIPERNENAALLRMCLPVGERRRSRGAWITVSEIIGVWNDGDFSAYPALPSTYVANLLHHTGTKYGALVKKKGGKLLVIWNGTFLVRELIDPANWGPKA